MAFRVLYSTIAFISLLAATPQTYASNQGFKFEAPSDEFTFSFESLTLNPATSPQPKLKQQPKFVPSDQEMSDLVNQARSGNVAAQDCVIELNYWCFLPINYQCGIWGDGSQNHSRLNPLTWDNIEQRAIANEQYAYAVIDAYEHFVRWQRTPRPPFEKQFKKLFMLIRTGAEAGNPNDQFLLGLLYLKMPFGLPAVSDTVIEATIHMEKAARQGHSLAKSVLGQIGWTRGAQGRNDIEATRWFLASKDNKISQDCLKKILRAPGARPQSKETFQDELDAILQYLGKTLERADAQVGVHDPDGRFREKVFAIPEVSTQYATVKEFHEELKGVLNLLKSSTSGLFLKSVCFSEVRDLKNMLDRQAQPPCVAIHTIDKQPYLVLNAHNVPIAAQFLTYLGQIDEKFAVVDKILKKDGKSYQRRLDHYLDELKEIRHEGVKAQTENNQSKVDELLVKFQAQTTLYQDKKALLEPLIVQIKKERKELRDIVEVMKGIIPNSAARDQEFLNEHPYLN
jgi:hypothetical protein